MALREFSDKRGRRWQAWSVAPGASGIGEWAGREELAAGWLSFECEDGERRRLAPVPADWESADETAMQLYCLDARRLPGARRRLIE